jgi:hypothetical protein
MVPASGEKDVKLFIYVININIFLNIFPIKINFAGWPLVS